VYKHDSRSDFIRPRAVPFSPGAPGGPFELVVLELSHCMPLNLLLHNCKILSPIPFGRDVFCLVHACFHLSFDFGAEELH